MNSTSFCLDGIRFFLETEGDSRIELPLEYLPFVLPDSPVADCDTCYKAADAEDRDRTPAPGYSVIWQNEMWRMGRARGGPFVLEERDRRNGGWLCRAAVKEDFSAGTLYFGRTETPGTIMPFDHPHDRPMILGRLAHLRGAVVHSSCVVANGRAMLFVGPSGTGKTTMARIWARTGATILNDENNIIRIDRARVLAGASPWHGMANTVSAGSFPLAGIFHLAKEPANRLAELSTEESVTRLFTTTVVPVFLPDGPSLVMDAWGEIPDRVPSYELGFVPDEQVVPFCLAAVSTL